PSRRAHRAPAAPRDRPTPLGARRLRAALPVERPLPAGHGHFEIRGHGHRGLGVRRRPHLRGAGFRRQSRAPHPRRGRPAARDRGRAPRAGPARLLRVRRPCLRRRGGAGRRGELRRRDLADLRPARRLVSHPVQWDPGGGSRARRGAAGWSRAPPARRGLAHSRARQPQLEPQGGHGLLRDRARHPPSRLAPLRLCHRLRRDRRRLPRPRGLPLPSGPGGRGVTSVRPKVAAWRGVVDAMGFLVDTALVGETETRRRILGLWEPGATVHRAAHGWLIRLPEPRRVRCDRTPGLPLTVEKVPMGRVLVSAPFTAEDLRALDPPDGAVLRLWAGDVLMERPAEAERVDPAAWLDVSAFQVAPAATLGAPPVTPRPPARERESFDLRARLKGVPPAAPELAEVLAALTRRKGGGTANGRAARPAGRFGAVGHWLH